MASNQPTYAPLPAPSVDEEWEAWNPAGEFTAEFVAESDGGFGGQSPESAPPGSSDSSERGKHRLPKQRSIARGSTVLGVAAIAAVGAGGMATAADKSPIPISLPDLPSMPDLPKMSDMPGIGDVVGSTGHTAPAAGQATSRTLAEDAGEALRARILDQAAEQRDAVDQAAREAAAKAAAATAAKEAAAQKVRDDAAATKAAAEAKQKADEEAAAKAEAERLAQLAATYTKPVASYTLTAGFGETSSLWATTHTGQDFAAPTGTPVSAIHSGTITSAGWAGSYGYRIVLTLDDGTEVWYCHLSSMVVTSGKVTTGDTIGRVGATGNVTGPHLHLEVRPGGGAPIDPMPWLRDHGIAV